MKKRLGLTKQEEADISRRMRAGDPDAVHELVLAHIGYAVRVAKRLAKGAFPHDEIKSAAVAGLYDAARRWRARNGRFTSYSSFAVRRKVYELWSAQIGVKISCKTYNKLRRAGGAIERLSVETLERKAATAGQNSRADGESKDPRPSSESPDLAALFFDEGEDPTRPIQRSEALERLKGAMHVLRPREMLVITGRYFEGRSLVDIGRNWKPRPVSGEWMRVVHDSAIRRLRDAMSEEKKDDEETEA